MQLEGSVTDLCVARGIPFGSTISCLSGDEWMSSGKTSRLARVITGLVLFGVSFGYIEAAVVVYLRAIYDPVRQELHPQRFSGDLFPLISLSQLEATGPEHVRRLKTELGREFATLVLLTAGAALVARNFRQWIAAFVMAFGIWDIFYYVFLKLLIDWPASLTTWDILFLLPLPWVGPVVAPMIVATVMIIGGALVLGRELRGHAVPFRAAHWVLILAGGAAIVVSFCWDFRNVAAGGYPRPFNWTLFLAGLVLSAGAFAQGFWRGNPVRRPAADPTA